MTTPEPQSFESLMVEARRVRSLYAGLEAKRYGRSWTRQELMLGFVGDVGDLAKLVQAKDGVRGIADADAKLAHELADCLWSVMTLADQCGVDLERAFLDTMRELSARIAAEH